MPTWPISTRSLPGNLNLAVRRNIDRFPEDFIFQLTQQEYENLRLQFARSSSGYGGRRFMPYAFTEHGVAMLSSVLNSRRAVQMNILIIRAFVRLRELLATHKDLARGIEKLEAGQRDHAIAIGLVAKDVQSLANTMKKEMKRLSPREVENPGSASTATRSSHLFPHCQTRPTSLH